MGIACVQCTLDNLFLFAVGTMYVVIVPWQRVVYGKYE